MQQRIFGRLGMTSALSLGGGIGQVWGATTRAEAVATVREAVEAGITLLDVAPSYGDGEAERVIGEAFEGRLPAGVRVLTKCRVGAPDAADVLPLLIRSLSESLERLRLERVDLFLVHNLILPDGASPELTGTPRALFVEAVRPAFELLMAEGRIGAWGITGIGIPDAVIDVLNGDPPPFAVQCIANLLDSPGALKRYEGPARPRDIIAAAAARGVGVMGIRAVQAGALTAGFDRSIPNDHADMADYRRAAAFRRLAGEMGQSPAALAHRYALSMPGVSTVVLGVKNRSELRQCLEAEAMGTLSGDVVARIDATVARV